MGQKDPASIYITEHSAYVSSKSIIASICYWCSVTQSYLTIFRLWTEHSRPPCPSPSPKVCPKSCLLHQWCHPAYLILWQPLLLPSIFPSIRDFSNESAVYIRWPKYWSFSFNLSSSNACSRFISLKLHRGISLLSKWLSGIFSSTTVQRHWLFGAPPSLWSNSHNHMWPLGRP